MSSQGNVSFDHVLVVGFGAPTKPAEVRPFIEVVTQGRPIPKERVEEVMRHYEKIGGRSPYLEQVSRFVQKAADSSKANGIPLPFFLGMRNWHPFLKNVLGEINRLGLRRGILVVLAPHRSFPSYGQYLHSLEEAKKEVSAAHISYADLPRWNEEPLWIRAHAEEIERSRTQSGLEPATTRVLFSAHSIPKVLADESLYERQFLASSELIARAGGIRDWRAGYQSRSGNPAEPWLEPDVVSLVREAGKADKKSVLLAPIGFLCDNVEILYDLDIEIRGECEKVGLRYARSGTILLQPLFIQMVIELIQKKMRHQDQGAACV